MHSTGSIIKTYIEKVRHYLDDPDVEAKYDDNYLVRFFLSSSMTDVISRVSMMSDNQILCRFTLQVTAGTERYKLPPVVRQVLRLGPLDEESKLYTEDFRPRNELSLFGPGWALEGNEIAFRPVPSENKDYVVLYVPSGDIACHYGTGTLNANGTFTMGAVPTIGSLDKRPGAYIGSYLRILGANVVDEILISAHDTVTRILSTRIAATNAAGTYTYEIVPFLMEPMVDAISLSAAMRAGVGRKVTQAQMQSMAFAYKQAIKTAYDTIGNMNSRVGKRFTGIIDTYGTISTAFPGGSTSGGGPGGTIPTCLPPCEPAEDDVSGTWPNLTVEALQGNPVSTDAPADGEVLTWDSGAGEWVPEPIPPQSGGEFRWYVSQSQGLDTNDGLTPATPFKTLAKVMTVAQPYDEILLKCGDRWREQINAPSMDNLTISSYGVGEKPVIDGSDLVSLVSSGANTGILGSYSIAKMFQDALAGIDSIDVLVVGDSNSLFSSEAGVSSGWTDGLQYGFFNNGGPVYATPIFPCGLDSTTQAQGWNCSWGNYADNPPVWAGIGNNGITTDGVTTATLLSGNTSGPAAITNQFKVSVPDGFGPAGSQGLPSRMDYAYYSSASPTYWDYISATYVPPTNPMGVGNAFHYRVVHGVFASGGGSFYMYQSDSGSATSTVQQVLCSAAQDDVQTSVLNIPANASRTQQMSCSWGGRYDGSTRTNGYPVTGKAALLLQSVTKQATKGSSVSCMAWYGGATATQIASGASSIGVGTWQTWLKEARTRQIASGGSGRVVILFHAGANADTSTPGSWVTAFETVKTIATQAWSNLGYTSTDLGFVAMVSHVIDVSDSLAPIRTLVNNTYANSSNVLVVDLGQIAPYSTLSSNSWYDNTGGSGGSATPDVHLYGGGYDAVGSSIISAINAYVPNAMVETYDVLMEYYYTTGSISAAVSAYSYSTYAGLIHVGVYIDGVQLTQQTASVQPATFTAAGFYVATTGSPNYTPTGNVDFTSFDGTSLVGRVIEIAVRPYAIRLGDNCTVKGIVTMRNTHNDGSLVLGLNARIEDCECNDGSKHNCFVASGYLKRVRCSMANRRGPGEPGMEAGTLFVAFNQDPSLLKVVWDECSAYGASSTEFQFGLSAFFAHGVGNPYGTLVVKNCFVESCNTSVGGDWTRLLVADSRFVNCGNMVFGGSQLSGSKTVLLSSVLHTGSFIGDRVVQAKTRTVTMRGCEIIASHLASRFIVDTEDDTATAYQLAYCTFVEDSKSSPTALGLIKTRSNQSLSMYNCALFQSDESPTSLDALATPIVVVDNTSGHTPATNSNNLYHAGFQSLIRNNYYEGTPRRVRYDRGGTIFIGQDVPTGNSNTSALWINESTLATSTMDGANVNGPVLPYSTRLPSDTGTAPNVSFVGLADAQLPSHGEWISYPKSSWVALNGSKLYGACRWNDTAEKAMLMNEFGLRP